MWMFLHVLRMTPKTCLPFIFILSSLPFCLSFCVLSSLLHAFTHSFTHFFCTSLPSLVHSLTHLLSPSLAHLSLTLWQTHTRTHTFAAQPLRVVTEDTCLFHYLVPAPMSPSNKSVGSDAGSQDSGDGNAGPRSERAREMGIGCLFSFFLMWFSQLSVH